MEGGPSNFSTPSFPPFNKEIHGRYTCYKFVMRFEKNSESDSVPTSVIETFQFRFRFRPKKFQCSDSVSEIMETVTLDSGSD